MKAAHHFLFDLNRRLWCLGICQYNRCHFHTAYHHLFS